MTPRISSTPSIGQCAGFAVLRDAEERTSSKAADNGSAAGRIIELWHKSDESGSAFDAAVATVRTEAATDFPMADMDQAVTWALAYCSDVRNKGTVVGKWCEEEVRLTLPADPEDPNQTPFELLGHVDQIRRHPITGQLRVWDVKTGRGEWKLESGEPFVRDVNGLELLYAHAWQIAAYALAASATLGELVLPGGIIRLRGYDVKKRIAGTPHDVHFDAPWTHADCRSMLATLAFDLGLIRRGIVATRPGKHCGFCPGEAPNLCGSKIDAALRKRAA